MGVGPRTYGLAMEQREAEDWAADVAGALVPVLVARAKRWHRLGIEAPTPDDLADAIAARAATLLRSAREAKPPIGH